MSSVEVMSKINWKGIPQIEQKTGAVALTATTTQDKVFPSMAFTQPRNLWRILNTPGGLGRIVDHTPPQGPSAMPSALKTFQLEEYSLISIKSQEAEHIHKIVNATVECGVMV